MRICPSCGNSYGDEEKYCPCCGNASGAKAMTNPIDTTFLFCSPEETEHANEYVEDSGTKLPPKTEPVLSAGADLQQPIWVTQSLHQPLNGPLDESFLNVPGIDDNASQQNPPANHMKSFSISNDADDTDIFDEIADTASMVYSGMTPKTKRLVVSLIIGMLLSLIPFLYVACAYNNGPTAGSKSQVTVSDFMLPN